MGLMTTTYIALNAYSPLPRVGEVGQHDPHLQDLDSFGLVTWEVGVLDGTSFSSGHPRAYSSLL